MTVEEKAKKYALDKLLEDIATDRKKHPIRWMWHDLVGWFFVALNSIRIFMRKLKK